MCVCVCVTYTERGTTNKQNTRTLRKKRSRSPLPAAWPSCSDMWSSAITITCATAVTEIATPVKKEKEEEKKLCVRVM